MPLRLAAPAAVRADAIPVAPLIVCQSCGYQNEEGSDFCGQCRAYLEWTGTKATEPGPSAVAISLKPRELEVEPGSEAGCGIEVRNQGTIVDEYRLMVTGEAAGWSRVEPGVLRLLPGTSGTARLALRPPRSPQVPAGPAGFVVSTASVVNPQVTASAAGTVSVAAFTDLSASLMPQVSESTGIAEHTVSVDNQGNAPVQVAVTVNDPNDVLSIDVTTTQLVLGPGQRAATRLRVAPRDRHARRDGTRRSFQVLLQSANGDRISLDGGFVPLTKPPSWFVRNRLWIAGAAALCLVGLVVWQAAAHGLISQLISQPQASIRSGASPVPLPSGGQGTQVSPSASPSPTPSPTTTPSPSAAPTSTAPTPTAPTAPPTQVPVATPPGSPTSPPVSLFSAGSVPPLECAPGCGDFQPWELGLQFSSDVNGYVTAIRFYKASQNTVVHQGHLWTSSGQLLATVTFSNESASGWQQANLPSPVRISAGQTYDVSFNTSGDFFYSANFTGANNAPLHGTTGVFTSTPGAFPSGPFRRNYWVDVVFTSS